ncbi:MAG: class I SAM-dependent methyltransferase [Acidimicrobiales bacterium]
MRALMNIEIESIPLKGKVLDLGGGARATYMPLLRGSADITTVDIDAQIEPTLIADLAHPLPFPDATYDTVISFNTLEHLADDQLALDEMVRVLKPGGTMHILVPFLYRVHGHPHDFHRHTAHGWNLMLRRAGVPDEHQRIRPLVWDPFATAWAIADVAPLGRTWWRARRLLRSVVLRRALVMRPIDRRLAEHATALISEYPLAYTITTTKPVT